MCTVAVCAGSGASVLNGVKADLYITGRHFERNPSLDSFKISEKISFLVS